LTVWSRFVDRLDNVADVVHGWDERAMLSISEARFLRRVPRVFVAATYLGDGYIWGGLALGLLIFGNSQDRLNVLAGFLITVANLILVHLLKSLFSRERPETGPDAGRARLMDTYSFPSGHATTSFGLAWLVATAYPLPLVQALVYAGASIIGLSRVVLQEHYLFDVVAGAILGTLVSASFLHLLPSVAL
jgi:membrane-associated phospholipid phosphatase